MWSIIRFVHLLALCVLVGGITFLSFIVAPSVFRNLPREQAGDIVSILFPPYYVQGYVAGGVLLVTSIFLSLRDASSLRWMMVKFGILVVMLLSMFYAGMVVNPRAHSLKEEIRITQDMPRKSAAEQEFGRLHTLSVRLNGLVLILALVYLGWMATTMRL